MSVKRNYLASGQNSTTDNDLLDMEIKYGKYLPWLVPVLQEVQFLRDGKKEDADNILDELDAEF